MVTSYTHTHQSMRAANNQTMISIHPLIRDMRETYISSRNGHGELVASLVVTYSDVMVEVLLTALRLLQLHCLCHLHTHTQYKHNV